MSELDRRVAAAQMTYDEFYSRPFVIGKSDCASLAKWHARKIGCPFKTGKPVGAYTTALGMKRALARLGCKRVGDICDKQKGWLAIPPASAWPGDIIEIEGEDGPGGIGTLCIVLTNGRVCSYHSDAPEGARALQVHEYRRAWRLPVKS